MHNNPHGSPIAWALATVAIFLTLWLAPVGCTTVDNSDDEWSFVSTTQQAYWALKEGTHSEQEARKAYGDIATDRALALMKNSQH